MGTRTRILIVLVMMLSLTACARQPAQAGSLSIQDAWARPGLSGGNSAVYFTIANETGQSDKLLRAESDAAEFVEVHMTTMDAEGNMRMQQQESVPVAAGSQVEFKPGGLHIMLIGLHQDLAVGQDIQLTLHFETSGAVQVQAKIQQP